MNPLKSCSLLENKNRKEIKSSKLPDSNLKKKSSENAKTKWLAL